MLDCLKLHVKLSCRVMLYLVPLCRSLVRARLCMMCNVRVAFEKRTILHRLYFTWQWRFRSLTIYLLSRWAFLVFWFAHYYSIFKHVWIRFQCIFISTSVRLVIYWSVLSLSKLICILCTPFCSWEYILHLGRTAFLLWMFCPIRGWGGWQTGFELVFC